MNAETRKKTGILGGTFNPIHNGHLQLAQSAMQQYGLDEVIFMPAGCPYLKDNASIPDGKTRYDMVKLAIRDFAYFSVSDMEINRPGYTYTYETILNLKKINPHNDFFFILGADCLFSIDKWKEMQTIFDNCTLLVAIRNNIGYLDLSEKKHMLSDMFGAKIEFIDFAKKDISSTHIRKMFLNHESTENYLPEQVALFIKNHRLYES